MLNSLKECVFLVYVTWGGVLLYSLLYCHIFCATCIKLEFVQNLLMNVAVLVLESSFVIYAVNMSIFVNQF